MFCEQWPFNFKVIQGHSFALESMLTN